MIEKLGGIEMQGKDKSSVTVKKHTRRKLNALSILREGSTLDHVIDSVITHYVHTGLTQEENNKFDLLVELLEQQDKKF